MMTKMGSHMSPEGFVRNNEWLTGSLGKDRRLVGGSSRMERLLGLTSSSVTPPSLSEAGDLNELKEEDLWAIGADEGSSAGSHDKEDKENYVRFQSVEGRVLLHNSIRRMGLERESGSGSGLSLAFGDAPGNRSRGLSALSSLTGNSNTRISAATRMIPQIGTSDVDLMSRRMAHNQSAPVNVPDWTKILGMDHRVGNPNINNTVDDDDDERLPPHEYIAREYARSQTTTTSVFEGVGRTLKGRDMSRVRNAVWSQTGFLG
eukprot:Gb_06228 [translate_table: standard]